MDDRTCDRCKAVFTFPWKLKRHQSRKTPCAPIIGEEDLPAEVLEDPEYRQKKCNFCGRVFSSSAAALRHIRTTCKIAPNKKNGDAGMEKLFEHTIRRQQVQLDALQAEVAEMRRQAVPARPAVELAVVGDHATVVQDRRTVTNNTLVINVFGQENTEHVTPDRIKNVLTESLQMAEVPEAAVQALVNAALLVYSDPERPENITCYLPNKREGSALVHSAQGWEVRPLRFAAPPMVQKSLDILFDNQPFEDADTFGPLMKELRDNEARYISGTEMRAILVRNKALLARALNELPIAGDV